MQVAPRGASESCERCCFFKAPDCSHLLDFAASVTAYGQHMPLGDWSRARGKRDTGGWVAVRFESCPADENYVSAPQERMDGHAVFLSLRVKFIRYSTVQCPVLIDACYPSLDAGHQTVVIWWQVVVSRLDCQVLVPHAHGAEVLPPVACWKQFVPCCNPGPPISCFLTSKDSQRRRTSPDWPNTRHHHESRQMPSRGSLLVPFASAMYCAVAVVRHTKPVGPSDTLLCSSLFPAVASSQLRAGLARPAQLTARRRAIRRDGGRQARRTMPWLTPVPCPAMAVDAEKTLQTAQHSTSQHSGR